MLPTKVLWAAWCCSCVLVSALAALSPPPPPRLPACPSANMEASVPQAPALPPGVLRPPWRGASLDCSTLSPRWLTSPSFETHHPFWGCRQEERVSCARRHAWASPWTCSTDPAPGPSGALEAVTGKLLLISPQPSGAPTPLSTHPCLHSPARPRAVGVTLAFTLRELRGHC